LVTNHVALRYFADRYGFEVSGSIVDSTSSLAETDPAHLEELRATVAAAGVPAIFSETGESDADVNAVAAQLGVEVVALTVDTLGPPGSDLATYLDLLRVDTDRIVDALASRR
jgi:ABC-type Zn uptake system ZnuABC Zn-binding protein ZnuA